MDGVIGALAAPGPAVSLGELGVRLIAAAVAGQAIGWLYGAAHGGPTNRQGMAQSTAVLAMVVCLIMVVIGDSLARAFGLGAALAVVRFRTPVKDARDAVFLILAVAAGMAAGVGLLLVALAGAAFVGGAAVFLGWSGFGGHGGEEGVLRMEFQGTDEARAMLAAVLARHCALVRVASVRLTRAGGPEELVYDVDLRADAHAEPLVRELAGVAGVSGVTLLPYARMGEGG